jgi:hypothetical protein
MSPLIPQGWATAIRVFMTQSLFLLRLCLKKVATGTRLVRSFFGVNGIPNEALKRWGFYSPRGLLKGSVQLAGC